MVKRFTETTKWDDPWFIRLPVSLKLLWLYLCDRCDASGVIDFCPELASIQIGAEVGTQSLTAFGERVQKLASGKWQIVKFLSFQYGCVDAHCPAHKPVIRLITANGLKYPINNLLDRVSNTLKEKDKDKEKDNKGESEGGKKTEDGFDLFWSEYPNKQAKPVARRAWVKIPDDEREDVMNGLREWLKSEAWQKDNGNYIPHPATFLNQRRWENSPKAKAPKKPRTVYGHTLPLAREPTEAEFKSAAEIARREMEKLRQNLQPKDQ